MISQANGRESSGRTITGVRHLSFIPPHIGWGDEGLPLNPARSTRAVSFAFPPRMMNANRKVSGGRFSLREHAGNQT